MSCHCLVCSIQLIQLLVTVSWETWSSPIEHWLVTSPTSGGAVTLALFCLLPGPGLPGVPTGPPLLNSEARVLFRVWLLLSAASPVTLYEPLWGDAVNTTPINSQRHFFHLFCSDRDLHYQTHYRCTMGLLFNAITILGDLPPCSITPVLSHAFRRLGVCIHWTGL